jgi:hypothetical protein
MVIFFLSFETPTSKFYVLKHCLKIDLHVLTNTHMPTHTHTQMLARAHTHTHMLARARTHTLTHTHTPVTNEFCYGGNLCFNVIVYSSSLLPVVIPVLTCMSKLTGVIHEVWQHVVRLLCVVCLKSLGRNAWGFRVIVFIEVGVFWFVWRQTGNTLIRSS